MYIAINELHYTPREWQEMTQEEKAFVIASVQLKSKYEKEAEEKAKQEAERQTRKHGRR